MTACLRTCMTGRAALSRLVAHVIAVLGSCSASLMLAQPAQAFYPREGTEITEARLSGGGIQSGRMSWFGQYGWGRHNDGLHRHVWRDSGDNGINASGLPQTVPGIALMDRRTLGHWFEVEINGRVFLVRQVDIGPHPRTGRKIDINAPLCDMAGYTPRNFPTDRVIRWRHVASPQQMIAMRQRPKLKQLALLETWDLGMSDQPRLAFDLVSPSVQQEAPNLTRANARRAPWLAAAPKTVDLLSSPRHWASIGKAARRDMEQALVEPQSLPEGLPEPAKLVGPPPDLVAPAPSQPVAERRVRPATRVARATYADASLETQVIMPILRLIGIGLPEAAMPSRRTARGR
ncbi:MAG: hypothetical protein NW223_03330 [Hyphomicrobiaceae bacterium]|nr:hypothetical protein [Hyphomicrobiaceae bacterium]